MLNRPLIFQKPPERALPLLLHTPTERALPLLLHTPKTVPILEPVPYEQKATPESKPRWGLLFGIGALAIGAAALVVAAALSSPNDVWAEVTNQNLIALNMHIENDQINIWNIYQDHKAEMESVVRKTLQESLGPDLEYIIAFQRGSLKVGIVARFKNAWNRAGESVQKQLQSVKLNLSALCRKIEKAITDFTSKVKKGLSSPVTKTRVKATFKVLPKVLSILANIATILNVLDPELAKQIKQGLGDWTGEPQLT